MADQLSTTPGDEWWSEDRAPRFLTSAIDEGESIAPRLNGFASEGRVPVPIGWEAE
jgi:hypothetical protein